MPPLTKDKQEKTPMADQASSENVPSSSRPATGGASTARPGASSGGFFTIYKHGQGYWTRMGTGIGGALVVAWTGYFLYQRLFGMFPAHGRVIFWSVLGAVAALGLLVWWIINKPGNADFLIATDGEMKKVNWTTREELAGSTKIVILFMFLIAAILFVVDIGFGYFFYLIDVLRRPPF